MLFRKVLYLLFATLLSGCYSVPTLKQTGSVESNLSYIETGNFIYSQAVKCWERDPDIIKAARAPIVVEKPDASKVTVGVTNTDIWQPPFMIISISSGNPVQVNLQEGSCGRGCDLDLSPDLLKWLNGDSSCRHTREQIPIDQVVMYGGMDRSSVPELKGGDEKFIAEVTKEFGSREKASEAWVKQGFNFYYSNRLDLAIKRFNQAWLLDPENFDVYWGFAAVLSDQGKQCEAKSMIDKVLKPDTTNATILADSGRLYTLCAASDSTVSQVQKQHDYIKSEELFNKAATIEPGNAYIYGLWATAYYWRGDYARSWEMVHKARNLGFVFPRQFIRLLASEMLEP